MSRSSKELMGTPDSLYYWIPGEMVVIVRLPRRPADGTLDTLVEQVRDQLNSLLARYDLTLEIYGTHGRWLDVPAMPPVRRRAFIFGLQRQQPLLAIFFHARHADPEFVDPTPMALSYLQGQLERLEQVGLQLVSAMPNWLVTAAPLFYGDGGPALPPRPSPQLDLATSGNAPVGWHITSSDAGLPLDRNDAQEVVVAVLDTAHHPDYIHAAASRPELRRNGLLQQLAANLKSGDSSFEIARV